MKKMNLIIAAAIVMTGFAACTGSASKDAKQDATNLNLYVDSVETLAAVNTVGDWAAVDNGYQERVTKANMSSETLTPAEKTKLEDSKTRFAALKAAHENKLKDQEAEAKNTSDYRLVLRNKLFGEGKIGTDMKFDYVTADNILGVYQNFVDVVAENKNNYTREDWDEIKVLYEALDNRKNTVEKDLANNDNRKIAGLKIKFATIKATHRGSAKAEENKEAKNK